MVINLKHCINKTTLCLFFMYFCSTAMAVYYVLHNHLPLSWDQSAYMEVAAQIGRAFSSLDFISAGKIFIWHDSWSNRPAMHMLVGGVFASLSNFNVNSIIIFSNMFWMGLIVYFTFQLSEYFEKNSGLLTVFLLLSSFSMIYLYRDFLSELALTCGVLSVEWSFFKSNRLQNKKWSFICCVCMILGALTKESFILYVFPLFLVSLVSLFFDKVFNRKPYVFHFILVYFFSALVISCFYIPILNNLLTNMFNNVGSSVGQFFARPFAPNTANYYLFYLHALSDSTSIIYVLIPLVVWLYFLTSKKKRVNFNGNGWAIIGLIFFPIIMLTLFVTDADYRFIVPVLPLILISCSMVIQKLSVTLKYLVIALFVATGVLTFVTSTLPIPFIPKLIMVEHYYVFRQHFNEDGICVKRGYSNINTDMNRLIHDVFKTLKEHDIKKSKIGVLPSLPYLNANTLRAYATLGSEPQEFFGFSTLEAIRNFDYVITTDKDISKGPQDDLRALDKIYRVISSRVETGEYFLVEKKLMPVNDNHLLIVKVTH